MKLVPMIKTVKGKKLTINVPEAQIAGLLKDPRWSKGKAEAKGKGDGQGEESEKKQEQK